MLKISLKRNVLLKLVFVKKLSKMKNLLYTLLGCPKVNFRA